MRPLGYGDAPPEIVETLIDILWIEEVFRTPGSSVYGFGATGGATGTGAAVAGGLVFRSTRWYRRRRFACRPRAKWHARYSSRKAAKTTAMTAEHGGDGYKSDKRRRPHAGQTIHAA